MSISSSVPILAGSVVPFGASIHGQGQANQTDSSIQDVALQAMLNQSIASQAALYEKMVYSEAIQELSSRNGVQAVLNPVVLPAGLESTVLPNADTHSSSSSSKKHKESASQNLTNPKKKRSIDPSQSSFESSSSTVRNDYPPQKLLFLANLAANKAESSVQEVTGPVLVNRNSDSSSSTSLTRNESSSSSENIFHFSNISKLYWYIQSLSGLIDECERGLSRGYSKELLKEIVTGMQKALSRIEEGKEKFDIAADNYDDYITLNIFHLNIIKFFEKCKKQLTNMESSSSSSSV